MQICVSRVYFQMEYNYRNLFELVSGDVFLAQNNYDDKDMLRESLLPIDGCDDRPSVVAGISWDINSENDFAWPTQMAESIHTGKVEEDDFGINWNLQSYIDEEEINMSENTSDKKMMELRMDETEGNPSQMTTNYFFPNSGFEMLYDYDPNSRFEGIDNMPNDNGHIMGEYNDEKCDTLLEEVMTISSSLEHPMVYFNDTLSDYSSFDNSSHSSTVPFSSTNQSNPVSTVSSLTSLDHSHSISPFYSPFSPSTFNMSTELSSFEPIISDDGDSADLGYSIMADSPSHSPSSPSFDTSNTIPSDDHSVLIHPSSNDSLILSSSSSSSSISPFSSIPSVLSTPSPSSFILNSTVSMYVESTIPLSPSIRLGKLVKSVKAVSGFKDNISKRRTKKSKEVAPIVTPIRKISVESRLAELFEMNMELTDCKTERQRLNYFALLLNARKPSRRNLNAKLALKKVLREELRPSQAAFAYGLTKKSFMKQYNRLMARAEIERRKMDMSVMFVSDEEGSGRMEENINRNVVPTQVYAVQEEVIGPIDDCNVLDHIFSIVFGYLFDGWDIRRGVKETVITLKTAIHEGNRPSRNHLPECDLRDDMDIENDVIPFYRKIVEEFKKIPELSQFVNVKRMMITGPIMVKK